MSDLKTFVDNIADKKPSELLDPAFANDLYDTVPTDSKDFVGLKMMGRKQSPTETIKYTALEPVKGLMYHVPIGVKAPVRAKRASISKKEIVVNFKNSYNFSASELAQINQANMQNSSDAEMRLAAEAVAIAATTIKELQERTMEKLFWEGCVQARMDVDQYINNTSSERQISTGVRQLTALAGNFTWDTAAASSTADPTLDIRAMAFSYRGKGTKLGDVYMSQETFNEMIGTSNATTGMRSLWKYTSLELEKSALEDGISFAGGRVKIYDGTYLNLAGTEVEFITDGYIVGFGRKTTVGAPVSLIEALNVEALDLTGDPSKNGTYGAFFYIKNDRNPASSQMVLSYNGLPVFENPQPIVVQQVF